MDTKLMRKIVLKRTMMGLMALLLLSFLLQIQVVMAHASLTKSDPQRRSSLNASPKQVQLWFNEKVESAYATIVVRDAKKQVVTENNPEAVLDDPKSLVLKLPDIEPGRYTVSYRVMSVDGHVIESTFDFNVKSKVQ